MFAESFWTQNYSLITQIKILIMDYRSILAVVLSVFTFICQGNAQESDLDAIADRVINDVLELRVGEVVTISTEPEFVDLSEALYVAIVKVGGIPRVSLSLPEAEYRIAKEVDTKYLEQAWWPGAVSSRLSDCVIVLESVNDPTRWQDVDDQVFAAFRKSGKLTRMIGVHDRQRIVTLGQTDGIPNLKMANIYGADYKTLNQNFWEAINVDHKDLTTIGEKVKESLKTEAGVRVKTPYGTDIVFTLDSYDPMISCGKTSDQNRSRGDLYAWLPAGDAFMAVEPSSANGTIVMPAYYHMGKKYINLKFEFKEGLLKEVSGHKDALRIKEFLISEDIPDLPLSSIDIGLNPESKVVGDFRSFEMSGMVSLGIGDNDWAGGDVSLGRSFTFHLSDATLVVAGKYLVDNGTLNIERN